MEALFDKVIFIYLMIIWYGVVDQSSINDYQPIETLRGSKGFRAPGLQGSGLEKRRAPALQDENFRALGLHVICFRDPGSTVVYNKKVCTSFFFISNLSFRSSRLLYIRFRKNCCVFSPDPA